MDGPTSFNGFALSASGSGGWRDLDHRLRDYPPPRIIWTNYKKDTDTYQGSLEHKESYTRAFLKLTAEKLPNSGYDTGNVERLLDALVAECTAMASAGVAARFEDPEA